MRWTFWTCLSALVFFPTYFVLNTLYSGFVIKTLWAWFMVPLGVVQIHLFHAIGLTCIVEYFLIGTLSELMKKQNAQKYESKTLKAVYTLSVPIIFITFLWFMGWIYHMLMIAYPNL